MPKEVITPSDIFSKEELEKIDSLDLSAQSILNALLRQKNVEKAEYQGNGSFLVTPKKETKEMPFTFKILIKNEGVDA
ncbi:MAG: hypothetical protein A3J63_00345 [Candidatus Moranbacteria bacterium RIFCSPHIGHO2_02_FULL_40_12b]|nr:MAG: hypothetical protein A3J63_00345 [Candidatus Moranbacteria bacterium RIFCSPHIGHO2_02_FULL_40_12b]